MFRKALTHIIIMTLAVLPVQLISASAEKAEMQMSMMSSVQMNNECLHASTENISEQLLTDKSCCDDQSHQCQSCNNCPQAASAAMFLPSHQFIKTISLSAQSNFTNYLILSGVPQQNILKPPRSFI